MNKFIRTTVFSCARCGCDHVGIVFSEFARQCGDLTHWALCPVMREPILMQIVTVPEAPAEYPAGRES